MQQKEQSENIDETILESAMFDQNDQYQLGKIYSECGNFIYHIFIIDFLQSFNTNKKVEIVLKTVFKNAKRSELSSINPFAYQQRFMNFITKNLLIDPFLNQKLSQQFKLVSIDTQTKDLIELYKQNHSEANLNLDGDKLDDSLNLYNEQF